ncbi:DUF1788 domain-containing protein [Allorhodopirellula solitaria]|uniref:DUF1788 domain-containing protein n=1 Tax=Allorhodopirellula solitaria TaxID=2527987 RepID=A0A5C5WPD2_9BACT|nr:DUF1788 domain-containing protein [Allorhodopirellula solitaria]TWT52019.1 hypothetical protein CA85_51290 [Allorhodopirellula solitaria]
MSMPLFEQSSLTDVMADLKSDLIQKDGPRISTMRNYRFAIVCYDPADEFQLRREVVRLNDDLRDHGWCVLSINLQKLLLDRIAAQGEEWSDAMMRMETALQKVDPERGLQYLKDQVGPLIEGPEGIAADCSRIIDEFIKENPEKKDRTVAMIGRAGALYPFYRSSALLKHLDGHTQNIPVVLLYPGVRNGPTGLSFMGVISADSDYRPRIYS